MNNDHASVDVLKIFTSKLKIIILWTIGFFSIAFIYSSFIATPVYQSISRIIVNQSQNARENLTNADIQTNLNLIITYQSIIEEPIILQEAINQTNSEYTVTELQEKLSFQIEDNSLVFGIVIEDTDPILAADLTNAVATIFKSKIVNILQVDSVTILSDALPNFDPVSPNKTLNIIGSLLMGFFVGIIHASISELRDNRVRSNAIITEIGWINLGSVSEMSVEDIQNSVFSKNDEGNLPSERERV